MKMSAVFKLFLQFPTKREMVFAFRNVVAATIALYVALRMGLPRPFWAPMATCIISQVYSGTVFVRGSMRLLGTCIGLAAGVVMMVMFINYTVLLCIGVGLWIGFCIYMSMMKRTTDTYVWSVAGFTVPVIIYGIVGDINGINISFITDQAVSRAQETGIGFICAALAHAVIFPDHAGPAIVQRADATWKDIRTWLCDALNGGTPNNAQQLAAVRALTDLRLLCANLKFERNVETWAVAHLSLLQDRMTMIVPLISTVRDAIVALKNAAKFTPELDYLLKNVAAWVATDTPDQAYTDWIRKKIHDASPKITKDAAWDEILTVSMTAELERLVILCESRRETREAVTRCAHGDYSFKPDATPVPVEALHKDYAHAFLVSLSGAFSISLVGLFWVASGWNAGFVAPMMASIFYLMFLRGDNSVFILKQIVVFTLLSYIPAFFYLLNFMYSAHSFEMLMMLFIPSIFIVGIFQTRPGTGLGATIFMMGIWSTTTMWDLDMANATSLINGQYIAQILGITMTLLSAMIFRSLDSGWVTKRLSNSVRSNIAEFSAMKQPPMTVATVKIMDNISIVAPRLPGGTAETEDTISSLFREMRAGIGVLRLKNMQPRLSHAGVDLRPLTEHVREHFGKPVSKESDDGLLRDIDASIEKLCESGSARLAALAAVSSIRRDLFPDALPWRASALTARGNL